MATPITDIYIQNLSANTFKIIGSGTGSVVTFNNDALEPVATGNIGDVLTFGPAGTVSFQPPGAVTVPDPLSINELKTNNVSPNAGSTINLNGPLVSTNPDTTTYYGFGAGGGINMGNTAIGSGALQSYPGSNSVAIGYNSLNATLTGNVVSVGALGCETTNQANLVNMGNSGMQNFGGSNAVNIGNNSLTADNGTDLVFLGNSNNGNTGSVNVVVGGNNTGSTGSNLKIIGSNNLAAGAQNSVIIGDGKTVTNVNGAILIGSGAGDSATAGNLIAIGRFAAFTSNSSVDSVAIGSGAFGQSNASQNIAIGTNALRVSNNINNMGIGFQAGQNTTGLNKIFIGFNAGRNDFSDSNLAIGNTTLQNGTTGIGNNTLVGHNISTVSRSIANTTALGLGALELTGNLVFGSVAVGNFALGNIAGSVIESLAAGFSSGLLSAGSFNTYLGTYSGYRINGSNNTWTGHSTANNLVNVSNCTVSGYNAADNSTGTFTNSVLIGSECGLNTGNTTSSIVMGRLAAANSSSLNNSIILGSSAANVAGTPTQTVLIGNNVASAGSSTINGTVAVGHGALLNGTVDATNCTVVGFNSATHAAAKNSSIVIGANSMTNVVSTSTITIGNNTNGNGINIGNSSIGDGIIIGNNSGTVSAGNMIAIGNNITYSASALESVLMGFNLSPGGGSLRYSVLVGGILGSTLGESNVLMGYSLANNNTIGDNNVIIGVSSGANAAIGSNNIIIGRASGLGGMSQRNIIIGQSTGTALIGSLATIIGDNANVTAGTGINVALGFNAVALATGDVQLLGVGAGGTLYYGGQIIGDSTWVGGGLTGASIDNNGNIIRTPSDEKLKTNIEPLESAADLINNIKIKKFDFVDKKYSAHRQCGVIAQDLLELEPSLVSKPTQISNGGTNDYMSVNYVGLVPYLIRAVQELTKRVEFLEEKLKKK